MENRDMRGTPPDPKAMKKVGLLISVFMGVTMSFFLSLLGNFLGSLQGGQFTIPGFLISFAISTVISLVIGFIVPMKRVGDAAVRSAKLRPHSIQARLLESLISDCIYTPVITLAMVAYAYFQSRAHAPAEALEHMPGFFQMFIGSFIACMIAGYILIFIFMPLYMKLSMRICGIQPPPAGGPPAGGPPSGH